MNISNPMILGLLIVTLTGVADSSHAASSPVEPVSTQAVARARHFLEALSVGLELIAGQTTNAPDDLSYQRLKLKDLMQDWQTVADKPADRAAAHQLAALETGLRDLERDLVIESVRVLPCATFSWRRTYTDQKTNAKAKAKNIVEFRYELQEQALDWTRGEWGLARKSIPLDLSLEAERMQAESPDTFTNDVPDRIYEQKYEFYRAVANERQRVAAVLVSMELAWPYWKSIIERRRALGAKLTGIESRTASLETALATLRRELVSGSYATQRPAEQKAQAAFVEFKAAATTEDGDAPIIWPGASLTSSGRFAMEPGWMGMLCYDANESGLFRDIAAVRLDPDSKAVWSFSFSPPKAAAREWETLEGSWTYATRRYYFPRKNEANAVTQDITWSMLAPGTLIDTPGPAMALSDLTQGNLLPPDRVGAVLNGKPALLPRGAPINPAELTENWLLLFTENGAPQFPVLVVLENRPDSLTWMEETLEVKRQTGVGRCVVSLPYGAAPQPANESRNWKALPAAALEQTRQIVPLLTRYPLTTEEYFSVEPNAIRVWSRVSRAVDLKSDFCAPGKPYTPLPVMYALSLKADLGLKVASPLSDWLMLTKFGPYQVTYEPELEYRVPRARMWDRTELRPEPPDEIQKSMLDLYNGKFAARLLNFFPNFVSSGIVMPGYLMLTPDNRERFTYRNPLEIESAMAAAEPLVWAGNVPRSTQNNILIDPVTAQAYWPRGWRRGRNDTRMMGDMPNRQGHQMLGNYLFARFYGRWDILERHWDAILKGYSVQPARQDWAIPSSTSQSTGYVFCSDMLGDAWRCHHIMAALAGILGHTEQQQMAEYLGSIALLSTATMGHPAAIPVFQRVSNIYPGPYVVASPYVRDARVSLNGPHLYSLSGCDNFDYPIYDGLFTLYPAVGHYLHQAYPLTTTNWLSRDLLVTASGNNRTFAMVHTANYLKYLSWSRADRAYVAQCWSNLLAMPEVLSGSSGTYRNNVMNALPHFIAHGQPVWLAAWDKARLADGTYSRSNRLARITLIASRPGTLKAVSAEAPAEVALDHQPLATGAYSYTADNQQLEIPFGAGRHEIAIRLPPDSPPKPAARPAVPPEPCPVSGLLYIATQEEGGASTPVDLREGLRIPGLRQVANRPTQIKPNLIKEEAPPPGRLSMPTLSGDIQVAGRAVFIDLKPVANSGWAEALAPPSNRTTQTWSALKGRQEIRGAPFELIDPAVNGSKACLVFKSGPPGAAANRLATIPANLRPKRLFFLHALADDWPKPEIVLTYILKFKGGKTVKLQAWAGYNIASGRIAAAPAARLPDLEEARGSTALVRAPPDGFGAYVMAWDNDVLDAGAGVAEFQKELAVLETIDLISSGPAQSVVLAITAETAP